MADKVIYNRSGGAGQTAATPQTAFSGLEERLNNLREASNRNATRLQEIVDRMCGPQPEKDGIVKPREVPNGGIASLNGRIDDLYNIDAGIASLLDRLSTVI